jgi:hypothetical protein
MDWNECQKARLVKSVSPDADFVMSLQQSAEHKQQSQLLLPMQSVTAASKVSLAYDALREKLEALSIKHGWKVLNHECYCAFLKEQMHESDIADVFDVLRKLRNDVNYYGKEISTDDANKAVNQLLSLTKKVDVLLKRK